MALPLAIPAVIGLLISALGRFFATRIGQWVGVAMLWLGIGFATKTAVVDPILGYLTSGFAGLPGDVAQWIGLLNVDVYASAVASAYIAAAGKRVILRKLAS